MINFLKQIFSYIFPPSCIICTDQTQEINLCKNCLANLPLTTEFPRPWIFSLYRYKNDSVKQCVTHIKTYPDELLIAEMITCKQIMLKSWLNGLAQYHNAKEIILVPTPIHYSRFLDRGFNQSELIVEVIKKVITLKGITITAETSLIKKQHATEKQATISNKKDRLNNPIKSSFQIQSKNTHSEKVIIIIDDVTTTGATLDAIREHLLEITPNVYGFTLSH